MGLSGFLFFSQYCECTYFIVNVRVCGGFCVPIRSNLLDFVSHFYSSFRACGFPLMFSLIRIYEKNE